MELIVDSFTWENGYREFGYYTESPKWIKMATVKGQFPLDTKFSFICEGPGYSLGSNSQGSLITQDGLSILFNNNSIAVSNLNANDPPPYMTIYVNVESPDGTIITTETVQFYLLSV